MTGRLALVQAERQSILTLIAASPITWTARSSVNSNISLRSRSPGCVPSGKCTAEAPASCFCRSRMTSSDRILHFCRAKYNVPEIPTQCQCRAQINSHSIQEIHKLLFRSTASNMGRSDRGKHAT